MWFVLLDKYERALRAEAQLIDGIGKLSYDRAEIY